jgi:hypothetical protein
MTQWQFLIQKEGDGEWLPLEASSAEILEGRYQLIVQSHQPGADIEVQIRHEYEMGGILQEVTQRQRQQADASGYFDLLSSTYLPPGLWELNCRATQDQADARGLSNKLSLQVLAQDFEFMSDWDVLDPSSNPTEPSKEAVAQSTTIHSAPVAQQKPTVTKTSPQVLTSVTLPIISKDAVPLVLHTVPSLKLPPMIYSPAEQGEPISPQLPDFLPLANLYSEPDPAVPVMDYLEFLRSVAKSADRDAVSEAFESLEWPQRFLSTLDTLAQPDAEALVFQSVPI